MGKNSYRIIAVLLLITGGLYFCKQKVEVIIPTTDVDLLVVSTKADTLKGAIVAIFDNQDDFNQAQLTRNYSNALKVDTTDNKGKIYFAGLKEDRRYFFAAYYNDNKTFPGNTILWDNTDGAYFFLNNLIKSSVTYSLIVLSPVEGFVTFWTQSENLTKTPIGIRIGSDSIGSIATGLATAPAPFGNQAITYKVKKGVFNYQAKNALGCVWIDTINVVGGINKYERLPLCTFGTLSFGVPTNSTSKLPITVVLNQQDTIGQIVQSTTNVVFTCKPSNTLSVIKSPGKYTYTAISKTTGTAWTGIVNLKADSCKVVYLP